MIKQLCFALALCAINAAVQAASAEEDLARSKHCLGCHAVNKKVLGPSFVDVAQKYAGQAEAEAMLVKNVMLGSKGVWGQVAMPPNKVTDAEALTLVKWIMAQK